uniref:Inositol-1-monophosphatase n=1 Tax=Arcella intermedia TaxID=1963864 RepID=A0A6B2LEA0_9EUKA
MARKAGEKIKVAFGAPKQITFKADIDLVTKTDKEVEEMLMGAIRGRFPDHKFVAEENVSDGKGEEVLTEAPTWLIDPIDGTTNFVHKFPFCCVSIGLAINKQVVVGVVYNPMLDELFTAIKGQGAKKNGTPIQVSTTDSLQQSLVATGFPYDRSYTKQVLEVLQKVVEKVRDVRRAGSAALDMCYVASGVFEAYYENGIHAWDVAAGSLILLEAGGVVSGFALDKELDICKRQIVATNAGIAKELRLIVKDLESIYRV